MDELVRLAVVGAGLMGQRHAGMVKSCRGVKLTAIVDPGPVGRKCAAEFGVPWYEDMEHLFAKDRPDGVILATPNRLHVENGLTCVTHRCPMLIEKPLATSSAEALELVERAQQAGVEILVGHHRRHNPAIHRAREIIDAGELGQLRSLHMNCWLYKPDDYFAEAAWRVKVGAGPLTVNLVHDLNVAIYLCGDVSSVFAYAIPSRRGHDNEDVAVVMLQFSSGVLATLNVSDAIVSPWSWELTAAENPAYPPTSESCYLLGGSHASLSLPDLRLWRNEERRSWWSPISATTLRRELSDPFVNQIIHFAAVVRRQETPLISALEGLKTLQVVEAIQQSIDCGQSVSLEKLNV